MGFYMLVLVPEFVSEWSPIRKIRRNPINGTNRTGRSFLPEAVRRTFGAEDAQRLMPSA